MCPVIGVRALTLAYCVIMFFLLHAGCLKLKSVTDFRGNVSVTTGRIHSSTPLSFIYSGSSFSSDALIT